MHFILLICVRVFHKPELFKIYTLALTSSPRHAITWWGSSLGAKSTKLKFENFSVNVTTDKFPNFVSYSLKNLTKKIVESHFFCSY